MGWTLSREEAGDEQAQGDLRGDGSSAEGPLTFPGGARAPFEICEQRERPLTCVPKRDSDSLLGVDCGEPGPKQGPISIKQVG